MFHGPFFNTGYVQLQTTVPPPPAARRPPPCRGPNACSLEIQIDPHTVYTFFWVKRVMSSAGALAHYMLEHVGAFVASVVQRLSAIYSSAIYSSTRLSRCVLSVVGNVVGGSLATSPVVSRLQQR